MGLNLNLQLAKRITQKTLEKTILDYGFKRRGKNKYIWFEDEQTTSLTGCYLYYNVPSPLDQKILPNRVKLIINAATYDYRSYEDLEMQNLIIEKLQKEFGGTIYNPHLKSNELFINNLTKLTSAEKKFSLVLHNFESKIKTFGAFFTKDNPDYEDNPQVYSLLIPFLVSLFESFFYEFFVAYLDAYPEKLDQILSYRNRLRLNYYDLKNILREDKTLSEVEAQNHNFQNLQSLDQAFYEIMGLNILNLWRLKVNLGDKKLDLLQSLENLIRLRHKIIHKAFLDEELTQQNLIIFRQTIEQVITKFIDYLNKKGYRIGLSKYLEINLESKIKTQKPKQKLKPKEISIPKVFVGEE